MSNNHGVNERVLVMGMVTKVLLIITTMNK